MRLCAAAPTKDPYSIKNIVSVLFLAANVRRELLFFAIMTVTKGVLSMLYWTVLLQMLAWVYYYHANMGRRTYKISILYPKQCARTVICDQLDARFTIPWNCDGNIGVLRMSYWTVILPISVWVYYHRIYALQQLLKIHIVWKHRDPAVTAINEKSVLLFFTTTTVTRIIGYNFPP